jgi:hypothetical protein
MTGATREYPDMRMPTKPVIQPTLSAVMNGWLRIQVPCSVGVQQMFDLAPPSAKMCPAELSYVQKEANVQATEAVQALQNMLRSSPQLMATSPDVGLSYAVLGGKLQYIYQLGVMTR